MARSPSDDGRLSFWRSTVPEVRERSEQPASPVSAGDVRFAKIGATFPRVSETMRNL
jgi:hypothetical protein